MPLDNPSPEMDQDNIQTLISVIKALELSPGSSAQLVTFIEGLAERSKPQFQSFLTFILKFVGYNRSRYLQMQIDLNQVSQELQTLKNDFQQFLIAHRNVNTATLADASQQPFVAQPASRPPVTPATDRSLTINVDGTVSRKMYQVGNTSR